MKLKHIIPALFAIGLFACYDDEGNYDYQEINEISVDSLKEQYSAYMMTDTLRISPILKFTQDSTTEGRFEYSWYLSPMNTEGKITKISNQRNLEYHVTAPEGNYYLSLGVKDLNTGVEWLTHSKLRITTLFSTGWVMLGEKNGETALDMVSINDTGDTITTRDILKTSGLPTLKGPRKMVSIYRTTTPYCLLMTDDGTFEMDRKSFTFNESTNIREIIYDPSISDEFSASDFFQNGSYQRIMLGDNKIFVNGSLIQSNSYGNCINKYSQYSEEYFKTYPVAIRDEYRNNVSGSVLVYDMDNKQFASFKLVIGASSDFCNTLPDNDGDPFKWKTGNEMIAINNSLRVVESSRVSYAVMKSPDNKYYLYSMLPAKTKKLARYDISALPGISQAAQFGFSSKYPRMVYAAGSKLYACEFLPSGITYKELEDFGDEITMIHNDNDREANKDFFYVATYNETNGGTVQKYQLVDDPNDIKIEKLERSRWEKLCKVTSMCWKWN